VVVRGMTCFTSLATAWTWQREGALVLGVDVPEPPLGFEYDAVAPSGEVADAAELGVDALDLVDEIENRITVYRDANFRGASIRFDNDVQNLGNTGFNDAISSMRFQGEWLACSDAYYRGTCVTFRNDIRNLRNAGLNDRISSLRQVR
jgi:hypothetical protein